MDWELERSAPTDLATTHQGGAHKCTCVHCSYVILTLASLNIQYRNKYHALKDAQESVILYTMQPLPLFGMVCLIPYCVVRTRSDHERKEHIHTKHAQEKCRNKT